ncbi:predicted protein [Naegleria gruberi]|uniref:Predicted protein n=1 Tax=Naegleria gruberi TaxID=5762 RepID=D2VFA1_NAEGR|nr:uncharacterized protein NAEGRDRAFT_67552 [Naegleria gruberi]EFC44333.1 predicted protein [Naegleria gruberi]|eukprot:XP_002677077.1 predicted protein [Naegleria gruberi strain NEG-M]
MQQEQNIKVAFMGDDDYRNYLQKMWSDYSKLYQLENLQFTYLPTSVGTCLTYHPFDDFDILISLDSSFYVSIRKFNTGRRKPDGQLYNFTDFSSVYLDAPFALYQYDSDNSTGYQYYSKPNCTNVQLVAAYESEVHMSYLYLKRNNSLLSEREIEFLKFANSLTNLKTISSTMQERANMEKAYGFGNNSSLEYYHSLFMPDCQCANSACASISFQESDYWIIPAVALIVVHYLVLFISKSFLTPSLKSRLLIPYLPFIVIFFEANNFGLIYNLCFYPRMLIFSFVITWYIMIYSLTIIRIYYLRNLYHLLSKNRKNIEKKLRFQKTISGPLIGLLFTFVGGFALCAFLSLPFYFVFMYIPIGNAIYVNIIIGIYVAVACLVGLLAIGADLIFNRKKIKEKGLRYLFFFDDPYMIRIELILISMIIVSIIIVSTIPNSHGARFVSFVIYVCIVLISGGMATLKNIFNKILITIRKNKANHHTKDEIEIMLQNSDFRNILREYCTKEMSLENFNIFTQLLEMKEKKINLTFEILKNIEEQYMALNSLFELNVPSHVRREFYVFLKEMESGNNSKENELKESKEESNSNLDRLNLILKDSILQNLGDTLSRLETTKEYEIWNEIYSIQSKTLQQ